MATRNLGSMLCNLLETKEKGLLELGRFQISNVGI
mgnify:CR=1 FL=1